MKKDFYDMAPQEREEYTSVISKNEIKELERQLSNRRGYLAMPIPQGKKERRELRRAYYVYRRELMTPEQIYETQEREDYLKSQELISFLNNLTELEKKSRELKFIVRDRVA